MKKAPKLSGSERSELQILHEKGYSARAIARALGRSPNTIAAELKRNRCGSDNRTTKRQRGTYDARVAKHKAYVRRRYAKYQGKKIQEDDELRSLIVLKLSEHWNPAEISGHLKQHPELGLYASKTAIYEWLYSAWGQQYCRYLPSRQYRPKKRKPITPSQTMIPDRVGIEQRPLAAVNRKVGTSTARSQPEPSFLRHNHHGACR